MGAEHGVDAGLHLVAGRARRERDVEAVLAILLGKAIRCIDGSFGLALTHRGFDEDTACCSAMLEEVLDLALHGAKWLIRKEWEEFLDG